MFKRYFLSIALILSLGVNLSAEENPELVQLSAHVYAYIGITEASLLLFLVDLVHLFQL